MYVPARYLICLDMILQDFCVRSKLSLTEILHQTFARDQLLYKFF
jgi:hypothetical protein